MYKLTFLTVLLAATQLSWAIPIPMNLDYDNKSGTEEEEKRLEAAKKELNQMLRKADKIIQKGGRNDPEAVKILRAAFGPDVQTPDLANDIRILRTTNLHVYDTSAERTEAVRPAGGEGAAWTTDPEDPQVPTLQDLGTNSKVPGKRIDLFQWVMSFLTHPFRSEIVREIIPTPTKGVIAGLLLPEWQTRKTRIPSQGTMATSHLIV